MSSVGQVLFVGDVGVDTTVAVSHLPRPDEKVVASTVADHTGGVVANAALACHRAGADVRLLCSTGDDPSGHHAVSELRAAGIVVDARVTPGATCRAFIVLEPAGEKRLILIPGVSMYPAVEQVRSVSLDNVAWAHTAAYDADAAALLAARCRKADLPWSVDLEPATFHRDPSGLRASLDGAAVVFVNTRAARDLGGDGTSWLLDHGVKAVILSRGSQGAVWTTSTNHALARAPHAGPVIDTTGAGDCLAGWFIAETIAGLDPVNALTSAVIAASLSCTRVGAQASYPDRSDMRRLQGAALAPNGNTQ